MEKLKESLKEHSYRQTLPRQVIYEYLSGTKEHPSAEMVYDAIKQDYPSISLNTVYNTLELFEKMGLAIRVLPETHGARFDANTAPHTHMVCVECGRVYDYDGDVILNPEELKKEVFEKTGFVVEHESLILSGHCNNCITTNNKEAEQDEKFEGN